jgi:hypothetical protein
MRIIGNLCIWLVCIVFVLCGLGQSIKTAIHTNNDIETPSTEVVERVVASVDTIEISTLEYCETTELHIVSGVADTVIENIETEYAEDYMELIVESILIRDFESAEHYTNLRNEKIVALNLSDTYQTFTWDDAFCIMCVIYKEGGAGSSISDDELMCYGNVVINRTKDSRFPNTIREVLDAEGQYSGFCYKGVFLIDRGDTLLELQAIERSFYIGLRVLNGEHGKNDEGEYCPDTVVWQSNGIQGKIWWHTKSGTYFCE